MVQGFGREKALQMGWCGGRAFQKAEGSRQRPVGGRQQPESQPRLAGGGQGRLAGQEPQCHKPGSLSCHQFTLSPGWLQKLVPLQWGIVCQASRVPTRVRPDAGDREKGGPVLAAHRGHDDQIAMTWLRRLKGHNVGSSYLHL